QRCAVRRRVRCCAAACGRRAAATRVVSGTRRARRDVAVDGLRRSRACTQPERVRAEHVPPRPLRPRPGQAGIEMATTTYRNTWWRRLVNVLVKPAARLGVAGKRTHV